MVTLLAKIFIQEKNDQAKIREEYGVLCGVVGILFNVLLFAGKFLAVPSAIPLPSRQMRSTTCRMRDLRS